MINHRIISTALIALSATAAAPAAADALTHVDPKVAFSAKRVDPPHVATLPDGRALASWTNGTNSGDTSFASVRPAGGLFPAPQVIGSGYAHETLRFVGGPGTPRLYYKDGPSRKPMMLRLDGSRFEAPGPLGGIEEAGRFPSVERCDDGRMVIAYQTRDGNDYRVVALTETEAGVRSGKVYFGPYSDPYLQPTASCSGGLPLVSFERDDPDEAGPETAFVRIYQLDKGYVLKRDLPNEVRGSRPQPRVAPDGRLWATWSEGSGATRKAKIATRAPGATGELGAPQDVGDQAAISALTFTPEGTGAFLLSREDATPVDTGTTTVRTIPAGTTTITPEEVVETGTEHSIRFLEGHPDGRPRLRIYRYSPKGTFVRGLPQLGTNEPEVQATGPDQVYADMAWLPSGDLLTVGVRKPEADRHELVEGGLDTGAPPVFDAVQVPSKAVLGEPVALEASASDPLGLRDIQWIVDGATITAAKVSHVFTTAGLHAVTVRATDRAGNATETTRTVAVIDPNPPAPAPAPVPGAGDAPAPVVTPAPVLDVRAPKVSGSAKRGRRGTSARRVKVRIRVTETSAVDMEVRGRLKGTKRGTLILASKRLKRVRGAKTRTTTITVPARTLKLTRGSLKLRAIATDKAGNRRVKTMTVKRTKR